VYYSEHAFHGLGGDDDDVLTSRQRTYMIDGRLRVTRGGRVSCNNDDDNNNKQSASHTHYHYYYYYYYNILVHVIYIYNNMHIDIIDIHTYRGKKCIYTHILI